MILFLHTYYTLIELYKNKLDLVFLSCLGIVNISAIIFHEVSTIFTYIFLRIKYLIAKIKIKSQPKTKRNPEKMPAKNSKNSKNSRKIPKIPKIPEKFQKFQKFQKL